MSAAIAAVVLVSTPASRLPADVDDLYADWSEPVNLGSVVNSESEEIEVAIAKDNLSLYFSSRRPGGYGDYDLWVSRRPTTDAAWGTAQNLGPNINTPFREHAPNLTIDGHRLYFSSTRPAGFGDLDLYVSRRHNKRDDLGWRPAVNLGAGINTSAPESLPAYFEDDSTGVVTLYFNSNRPDGVGLTDIYASTQQDDETFGPGVLVAELSTPLRDAAMAIRRDGLELILASDRLGTFGGFDLWVSTRRTTADPWSQPVNLGFVVNTDSAESRLALSFDATALYIISNRPGGSGGLDIWMSTRTKQRK